MGCHGKAGGERPGQVHRSVQLQQLSDKWHFICSQNQTHCTTGDDSFPQTNTHCSYHFSHFGIGSISKKDEFNSFYASFLLCEIQARPAALMWLFVLQGGTAHWYRCPPKHVLGLKGGQDKPWHNLGWIPILPLSHGVAHSRQAKGCHKLS